MHVSSAADDMFGDAANLFTDPSAHEYFRAIYRIQRRMQCRDTHTIKLMVACNQVVPPPGRRMPHSPYSPEPTALPSHGRGSG
jgi:hypothetical protein